MSSNSFKKEDRLLDKKDFAHLRVDSKKFTSKFMMAFAKDNRLGTSQSRLGISVSKKVGNAVKRNYLKRIIRENFRKSQFRDLGKDVLIVVHPKLYKSNLESVGEEALKSLENLFGKMAR